MGAHTLRHLDTGETGPVLDTRIQVLDTDRSAALDTARAKSAEALTDITGRVAR